MKYRYSAEDLSLYYSDTYLVYKGEPVYIKRVQWGNTRDDNDFPCIVTLHPFKDVEYGSAQAVVLSHIDKFFEEFLPLPRREGYVNIGATCSYVSRFARREAKKSHSWGSVQVDALPRDAHYLYQEYNTLYNIMIVKGLAGLVPFPKFATSISEVFNRARFGAAWHRDWAVAWSSGAPVPFIYYKSKAVGLVEDADGKSIVFHREADLLLDAYEESRQ